MSTNVSELLRRKVLWAPVGLVALLALPLVTSSFLTFQLTLVLVWALAALATNLLMGFGGQMSIALNAFFGLGAYAAGVLHRQLELPFLLTTVVAVGAAFLGGALLSMSTARLKGLYLCTATLAVGIVAPLFVSKWEHITGGDAGLVVPVPGAPAWSGLLPDQWRYYVTLVPVVLIFWWTGNLRRGPLGRAICALRDSELVAGTQGVDTPRVKVLLGAYSSAMAALAGALYVMSVGVISPATIPVLLSISFIVASVVGGIATIWGALIGGVFLQFAPRLASEIDPLAGGMLYGLIMIVFILFAPAGVVGLLRGFLERRKAPDPEPEEVSVPVYETS
jgi:branched-chain amino acid transport system permease protein